MKKNILILLLSVIVSSSYGSSSFQDDFSGETHFPITNACHIVNQELHLFYSESGYLCWQNTLKTPASYIIRAKMRVINDKPQSYMHAGLLFRVQDLNNSLLFFVNPSGARYSLGYWKKGAGFFRNKSQWVTLVEKTFERLHPVINYLDIVNENQVITLYINGEKVQEITSDILPPEGYVGFFASKNLHVHFDDLLIKELGDKFEYEPPVMEFKTALVSPQEDYPQYQYLKKLELRESFGFNDNADTPFEQRFNAYNEEGRLVIWETSKLLFSKAQAYNILIETQGQVIASVKESKNRIGVAGRINDKDGYILYLAPVEGKFYLYKKLNKKEILLAEKESHLIKKGFGVTNHFALSLNEKTLEVLINGETAFTLKDSSIPKVLGYGLASQGRSEFDYIRVYEIRPSFLLRILRHPLFWILLIISIIVFLKLKRNSRLKRAKP